MFCQAAASLYISDIAPVGKKGLFSSLHVCGVVLSHVVVNLLSVTKNWKATIYFISPVMFILGTCIWLIPDSPSDKAKIESKKKKKMEKERSENEESIESSESQYVVSEKDTEIVNVNDKKKEQLIMSLYDKRLLKKKL